MDFKYDAPLFEAVSAYFRSSPQAFHMPGHRFGAGIPESFAQRVLSFDVTEIPGTDNLHHPDGPIKKAQELAAKAFGARETFFVVNGSTTGIHAMILAVCKPGDKLIVSRNCHKSVIDGLILAGAEPVYCKPDYDEELGMVGGITPTAVKSALEAHRDAVGVLVTSPTYSGFCSDLQGVSRMVHSYGKILLVDEAHGAHFCFHNDFPSPALRSGADLCVQSAHKTLPVMTPAALLHIGSENLDTCRLREVLSMLQTSSPSYCIMTSLDVARAMLEEEGSRLFGGLLQKCRLFRERMSTLGNAWCIGPEVIGRAGINDLDLSRLVVNVKSMGISGYQVEKTLKKVYNIQVEMSDMVSIICIASIADPSGKFDKLLEAVLEIGSTSCAGHTDKKSSIANSRLRSIDLKIPVQRVKLREVLYCEREKIPVQDAVGRISAGRIIPYPPGIALVCPGEEYDAEMVEYLMEAVERGGVILGMNGDCEVEVVKESGKR